MENINIGINEKIVTGRKFRRLIDKDSKLWQLISWWTKAIDVEFDDGRTAEQKLGNINGITSDLNDRDDIASSIAAVNSVNEELQYRIGGFRIFRGDDGNIYIIDENAGADSVPKKLGDGDPETLGQISGNNEYIFGEDVSYAYIISTGNKEVESKDSITIAGYESCAVQIQLPNWDKYNKMSVNGKEWQNDSSKLDLSTIYYKWTRSGEGGSASFGVWLFLLKDIPFGTKIKGKSIAIFK